MNEKKTASSARKSIALSFYTFMSRILGLLRDHYMATTFGTGWVASAFSVAYRFPNMFRNLLAEGTLSQSFMPLYSEYTKKSEEEAAVMAGSVLSFLFFLLCIFVSGFILSAPFFIPYLVGGTEKYSGLVIELSSILFFFIMTSSLSSIFMAISNTRDKFFVPSLSPILLNIVFLIILVIVFLFIQNSLERIRVLSYGITLGGVLQLLLQSFYVKKLGYSPVLNLNWKHPAIKKIFQLMLPAAIGGGFYHISLLTDVFLANYIQNQNPGLGAVVSLDYSQRLIQFPTGIIGVALATTILPTLLGSLRRNDINEIPEELSHTLSFSLFLTIPASICFLFLGEIILDSIYFGGKWDHKATQTALMALNYYSFAIPMYSMNKVVTSSYYAFKDTRHPLRINAISFSFNIAFNLLIIHFMKHAGLALSSALSASLTFILLFLGLKKHSIPIPVSKFWKENVLLFFPILGLILVLALYRFFFHLEVMNFIKSIGFSHGNTSRLCLSGIMSFAILVYLFICHLSGLEAFKVLKDRFRRKVKT